MPVCLSGAAVLSRVQDLAPRSAQILGRPLQRARKPDKSRGRLGHTCHKLWQVDVTSAFTDPSPS